MFVVAGESGKEGKTEIIKKWEMDQLNTSVKPTAIIIELSKIKSLTFNETGDKMAVIGDNKVCLINNINKTNNPPKCVSVSQGEIKATNIEFIQTSTSKELIVIGLDNGKIKIFDPQISDSQLKQENTLLELPGHKNPSSQGVFNFTLSSPNDYLISSGGDQTIRIWNLSKLWNPNYLRKLKTPKNIDIQIGINKYNELCIILIDDANKGYFYNLKSLSPSPRGDANVEQVKFMTLIKNGDKEDHIIFINKNNTLKFYNLSKEEDKIGKNDPCDKNTCGNITTIISSKNGRIFILLNNDGHLFIFNKSGNLLGKRNNPIYKKPLKSISLSQVSLSQDGKNLAIIDNNQAYLWDLSDLKNINIVGWQVENNSQPNNANIVKINPNSLNNNLIISHTNGDISLYSLDGKLLGKNSENSSLITDLQFYPDGNYFATLDANKTVNIWQIKKDNKDHWELNKLQTKEINLKGEILKVSVTSYGNNIGHLLATISPNQNNPIIKVFDIQGRQISQFKTNLKDVGHLQFSPDRPGYEKYIIASDKEGTIEAWEIKNVEKLIEDGDQWFEKK
jgi:WD40 repeat protein